MPKPPVRCFQPRHVLLVAILAVLAAIGITSASAQPHPGAADRCRSTEMAPIDIPAPGSGRIALIIANQGYGPEVGALEATHADGETVCRALVELGFGVRFVKELNFEGFQREIQDYKHRLSSLADLKSTSGRNDRASFFYFSGHGAAIDEGGSNYLVPIGEGIRRRADLVVRGVNLDDIVRQVQEAARQFGVQSNFVVIDACRNVAFAAGQRSGTRGFNPVAEQSGMMIAFSTAPGKTAVDDRHYSTALARELQVPNRDAFVAFREVRRSVLNATRGHQFPWTHDGLVDEFVFKADANAPAPAAAVRTAATDILIDGDKPVIIDCDVCPRLRRFDPPQGAKLGSFALGMYEVTFRDWQHCVADGGCGGWTPSDSGFGRGRNPVINVSRIEAQLYLDWLSRRSGQRHTYRLPTDAEWDYAARDGREVQFVSGADVASMCASAHADIAMTILACQERNQERKVRGTMEVGRLKPSTAGLYDMAGNVWEWVDTCYADGNAPKSSGDTCDRILRGGSWRSGMSDLALTARRRAPPGVSGRTIGFRVARDIK